MIRTLETLEDLLAWLKDRPVHAFDAQAEDRRSMSGTRAGRTETVTVATSLFRQTDGMLVWAHDPGGEDLADTALFELRPPTAN